MLLYYEHSCRGMSAELHQGSISEKLNRLVLYDRARLEGFRTAEVSFRASAERPAALHPTTDAGAGTALS